MAKGNWNWLTTRGVAGRLPKAVHMFHAARGVASHARRAAVYGVYCALSDSELKAWFVEQPKQCFWCGIDGNDWHIDHFVPMSKGGPHHQDNLVKVTVIADTCGTMHQKEVGVTDSCGCRLHRGHQGPHEFVSDEGEVIQWETDWDCDCEHCMSAQGDYCTIYWRVEAVAN